MSILETRIPDPNALEQGELTKRARKLYAETDLTVAAIAKYIGISRSALYQRIIGRTYTDAGGPIHTPGESSTPQTKKGKTMNTVVEVQSQLISNALLQTELTTVLEGESAWVVTNKEQSEYIVIGAEDELTICPDPVTLIQICKEIAEETGDKELEEDVQGIAKTLRFPL